jgi:hypothetical protein
MRTTTRLVALALVMAACSPAAVETTTSTTTTSTTSTSTTTTIPTTTTTTLPEPPRSPVTGLPVEDETLLDRRLVAVKIDNHPRARPHAGIDDADMVIEILVEGGFTRYMTTVDGERLRLPRCHALVPAHRLRPARRLPKPRTGPLRRSRLGDRDGHAEGHPSNRGGTSGRLAAAREIISTQPLDRHLPGPPARRQISISPTSRP